MDLGEFYSSNTHVNDITGCVIWDGEAVGQKPVVRAPGMQLDVRKFVYETLNGQQPYRTRYTPSCENPLCVKMEHISVVAPEAIKHEYPQEKVREVYDLWVGGMRQDVIATKVGLNASTVSKYLKEAKRQITVDSGAVEQGG